MVLHTGKGFFMRRGKTVKVVCECGCGVSFDARVADRNRGWGRFFSKSCKARFQERRTGQYAAFMNRSRQLAGLRQLAGYITPEDEGVEMYSEQFNNQGKYDV